MHNNSDENTNPESPPTQNTQTPQNAQNVGQTFELSIDLPLITAYIENIDRIIEFIGSVNVIQNHNEINFSRDIK